MLPAMSAPRVRGGGNSSSGRAVITCQSRPASPDHIATRRTVSRHKANSHTSASAHGPAPAARWTAPANLYVEAGDDRRVIRHPFAAARQPIDAAARAARRQCRRCQDQVDPQPVIAPERAGAIVPPAEALRRLIEAAEYVEQPDLQ